MRLIDADALKKKIDFVFPYDPLADYEENIGEVMKLIDNAPAVDLKDIYQEGHYDGQLEGYTRAINEERPQGKCKTCKYYHPYCEQFSDKPRGDGYCVIARMTPEGMTTINCNDEFGCSDYQEGGTDQ